MYEVQKELYVYLDSLEDLKHYAEKKKRIDAEIERAEEEHAREAALYAQEKEGRRSAECRDDGSHFWSRDGGIFAGKRLCRRNQRGSLAVLCPYRCRSVACEYTVGLQICARLHRTLQEKENVNALRFSG